MPCGDYCVSVNRVKWPGYTLCAVRPTDQATISYLSDLLRCHPNVCICKVYVISAVLGHPNRMLVIGLEAEAT